MPNPLINIGSAANDGTGELGPRAWLQKVNRLPISDTTINAGSGDYSGTTEQKITAAIAAAVAAGAKYVWVPQSMLPYNASLVTFNNAIQMMREGGPPPTLGIDADAYGAAPDNSSDSTTALQAALAYAATQRYATLGAGSQRVLLSAGVYLVTTTLVIQQQVVLVGLGRQLSEIQASAGWTNPTPNAIVQLGTPTTASFGCRIENLTISANNLPNVIDCYAIALQNQSGAKNVLFRAFGAAGFQHVTGSGSITTGNGFLLIDCEAFNGVSGTGIGYDLNCGANVNAVGIINCIHSNASFPGNKNPAGFRLAGTSYYVGYNLYSEFATVGVQFGGNGNGFGSLFGCTCTTCTDAVQINSQTVVIFGPVTNGGGTNLINDVINSVVVPVAGNNNLPTYVNNGYQNFVGCAVFARNTLAYGATVTPNLTNGSFFTLNVTNGTAFTFANPIGYAPTGASAVSGWFSVDIFNNSGGLMGAVTFGNQYKLTGAFVAPATGNHRHYEFYWDGLNWRERFRSAADQAN